MTDTDIKDVIAFLRRSHGTINEYIEQGESFAWLLRYGMAMARAEYRRQPHWHHWTGSCVEAVPFELMVGATGFFGLTWYYEIMLRKARDRHSPETRQRTQEYRAYLNQVLDAIERDIDSTRDLDAEARHKEAEARKHRSCLSRLRHLRNKLIWGH